MVLILDRKGEEIDRIIGYRGNSKHYLKKLEDILKEKNTISTIEEKYKNNKNDLKTVYILAKEYYDRLRFREAITYFEILLDNQEKSKNLNLKYKNKNVNLYSEAKKYMKQLEMFKNIK